MKRADVTYGQLDKALRALGFTSRPSKNDPPGRVYEHQKTGSIIVLPAFPENDRVYEYHMVVVRTELDNFNIADPTAFAAKLQRAG